MRIDKLFVIGAMLVGAFAFSACSDETTTRQESPLARTT